MIYRTPFVNDFLDTYINALIGKDDTEKPNEHTSTTVCTRSCHCDDEDGKCKCTDSETTVYTDSPDEINIPVPGRSPSDISVTAQGNVITVKADEVTTKKSGDDDDTNVTVYEKVDATFVIPSSVNVKKIKARCENGALKIEIPEVDTVTIKVS